MKKWIKKYIFVHFLLCRHFASKGIIKKKKKKVQSGIIEQDDSQLVLAFTQLP